MSEKKYIDVDLLKSELKALLEQERLEYMGVYDCINSIPAADVAEVRHGKWLNFLGDWSTAECDRCGETYETTNIVEPNEELFNAFKQFYKYCPHCGAKMDQNNQSAALQEE